MKVSEFCQKYETSHQAVYKKIKKLSGQLDGHISKKGCLQLDDYAVRLLKPHYADSDIFSENNNLKAELSQRDRNIKSLKNEIEDRNSENKNLKNSLDEKISKIEDLENQLALQISKNDDLVKSLDRLTEDVSAKNILIEELRSANAELSEQLNSKSGGVLKSLLKK